MTFICFHRNIMIFYRGNILSIEKHAFLQCFSCRKAYFSIRIVYFILGNHDFLLGICMCLPNRMEHNGKLKTLEVAPFRHSDTVPVLLDSRGNREWQGSTFIMFMFMNTFFMNTMFIRLFVHSANEQTFHSSVCSFRPMNKQSDVCS